MIEKEQKDFISRLVATTDQDKSHFKIKGRDIIVIISTATTPNC